MTFLEEVGGGEVVLFGAGHRCRAVATSGAPAGVREERKDPVRLASKCAWCAEKFNPIDPVYVLFEEAFDSTPVGRWDFCSLTCASAGIRDMRNDAMEMERKGRIL